MKNLISKFNAITDDKQFLLSDFWSAPAVEEFSARKGKRKQSAKGHWKIAGDIENLAD